MIRTLILIAAGVTLCCFKRYYNVVTAWKHKTYHTPELGGAGTQIHHSIQSKISDFALKNHGVHQTHKLRHPQAEDASTCLIQCDLRVQQLVCLMDSVIFEREILLE
jgi:hypothetical protein